MATHNHRLQLGNRIRLMLMRDIEHSINVQRLLDDPLYARDVLLVCDAVPGGELASLAELFRQASRGLPTGMPDPRAAPGHAPQANDWGADTSGFGVSRPAPMTTQPGALHSDDERPPAPERRRNWLPRWRGPK